MTPAPDQGPVAILYVEDEQETRDLITRALAIEYPGVNLLTAADGAEGLKIFRERRPELVITDIRMPIMDGLQMGMEIRALDPDAEMIALTAYSDTGFLMSAIEVGFSHYVLKPTDFEKLFVAVAKSLNLIHLKRQVHAQHEEIRQTAEALEESNRGLQSFSYTVAHDLRKPLTVISGYLQILEESCNEKLDEECRTYVHEAYEGTVRMNHLIDALLLFSQASHTVPKRETVDLSATAREVAAELAKAEPQRKVSFRIVDDMVVEGDANLLRAVIANLMGNAWKYTVNRTEALIEMDKMDSGSESTFFVRDNGMGFDQKDGADLFAPFRRLPDGRKVGGLGIGLATVARIIGRHGGRVWAEGEPEKGATFYFTLPETH